MDVREKLVELLERAFDSFIDDPYCIPDEREFADHLIANGVTVQEWIPASEPPMSCANKVIVRCKDGGLGIGHYEDFRGVQKWYDMGSCYPGGIYEFSGRREVTHWMRWPDPPKGE